MDSKDKIERGHQARALLESPIFKEVLDKLEAKYIEAWRASLTVEKREDAHRYVTLLGWLRNDLREIGTTGTIEQARVDALNGTQRPSPLSEFKKAWKT